MNNDEQQAVGVALGRIPSGLFILTARNADGRSGILLSWVQQVSFEPPMVSVAIAKGRPIMPLLSESKQFGLCQLPENEKILLRKFAGGIEPGEDPFLGFEMVQEHQISVPILANALAYLECKVVTHMDVDGDHDLFVGRVVGGARLSGGRPHVHIRENGFKY